jgi:hypothetical protein
MNQDKSLHLAMQSASGTRARSGGNVPECDSGGAFSLFSPQIEACAVRIVLSRADAAGK